MTYTRNKLGHRSVEIKGWNNHSTDRKKKAAVTIYHTKQALRQVLLEMKDII